MPETLNIDKILENAPVNRHSFFQIKHFIIGKEPTIQAQLWRCIRELQSRKDSIDSIKLEIEQMNDTTALEEITRKRIQDSCCTNSEMDVREKNIRLRMTDRKIGQQKKSMENLRQKLKDAEAEADFFAKSYLAIEQKESLKPWDDPQSQAEYWNQKMTQELELRLMLKQPIDVEVIRTILSLDDKSPIKSKTIYMLGNKKEIAAKLEENH
jgi:hypothetical protein